MGLRYLFESSADFNRTFPPLASRCTLLGQLGRGASFGLLWENLHSACVHEYACVLESAPSNMVAASMMDNRSCAGKMRTGAL